MRAGSTRLTALILVTGLAASPACSQEPETAPGEFCELIETLRSDDPLARSSVMSADDLRIAFVELHHSAERVAAVAPVEVRVHADHYVEAIRGVIDELARAGYEPALVDELGYRSANAEYRARAGSLDNAADSVCTG